MASGEPTADGGARATRTAAPAGRRLVRDVILAGRGIHTAQNARVTIRPGDPSSGLRIRRGRDAAPIEPAAVVPESRLCTALRVGPNTVLTVEHLLAALAGTGAWNAEIDVDGPEIPILDGSARPWTDAILDASEPAEGMAPVAPAETMRFEFGATSYLVEPAIRTELAVRIGGGSSGLPAQRAWWDGDPDLFAAHFAPARTFALESDVPAILAAGLARGVDLTCAVVIGRGGPIGEPLRFPDEPARHKLVDLLGDLSLLGRPLAARVRAAEPHHAMNRTVVACVSDRRGWRDATAQEECTRRIGRPVPDDRGNLPPGEE